MVVSFAAALLYVVALLVIGYIINRQRAVRSQHRVLPGPRGLPLIGAVHKLASKNPWMTFVQWSKEYGPIYQVNLAGVNHVWIAREDIACDLLTKRSAIYSDRPHIPALQADNRTSGHYLPLMSKNDTWQRQLRFTKGVMRTSRSDMFHGHPELESIRLLREMLHSPSRYHEHLESFVSRVTCRLAWDDSRASDELKQRARELLITVSPTGHMGNKLPLIMSLPSSFCKAKAWEVRRARTEQAWFKMMQEQVQRQVELGEAKPSWMLSFLSDPDLRNERTGLVEDVAGAYCVGMNGIAGALTIAAPMQSLILALCLYPRHLVNIQAELDRECPENPPTFGDLPRLPYLRAALRETLRWRPPVPTGIPHEVTQDDVWNGFLIPKGSVLHPLEWCMGRDQSKYVQPECWNPERWLDPKSSQYHEPLSRYPTITGSSQFGFGRRVCPGQQVSEADLFVGMGSLLWAFDIVREVDSETGLELPVPECDFSSLLIAKPLPFPVRLQVRSKYRREWIEMRYKTEEAAGHFPPSKVYWDSDDAELGWGVTWM